MRSVERGLNHCRVGGCKGTAVVSVLVHVLTFGGRKDRKKATSGAMRLCKSCVGKLALGQVPVELMEGITRALAKVKEAA